MNRTRCSLVGERAWWFPSLPLGVWVALAFASPAEAGPHADGVMVLHRNPNVVFSAGLAYCGESGLASCNDAVTRADVSSTVVLHALAAFPSENSPRLAGVCYGIQYDVAQIAILEWGHCGGFELHTQDWPGSGEGSCVTWEEAQTGHLTEIAWFAAYSLEGNPSQLALQDHPTGGGNFADDAVPSNIDPIADYGAFGFYVDGILPCPDVPVPAEERSWGGVKAGFR